MFGSLGATEILVLAVIGLLVFGPRRLPEMGRTLGKTLYEFRKAAMELRTSIEREINLEELKQAGQSLREGVREGAGLLAPPSIPATPNPAAPATPTASAPASAPFPAQGTQPAPGSAAAGPPGAPGSAPAASPRPATLADAVEAPPAGPPLGNRAAPPGPPAEPPAAGAPVNGASTRPAQGDPGAPHPTDEAPGSGNVVPKG